MGMVSVVGCRARLHGQRLPLSHPLSASLFPFLSFSLSRAKLQGTTAEGAVQGYCGYLGSRKPASASSGRQTVTGRVDLFSDQLLVRSYRGTSPIRKHPPPYDPPMTLGIGLFVSRIVDAVHQLQLGNVQKPVAAPSF